jgi:hypothetical protein
MKTRVPALLGIALALFLTGRASAQAGNPYYRPPVSPYLNQYRPGASQALNYLTLVRPELDARNAIQQLQQQTDLSQRATASASAFADFPATGHQAGFMTQGRYFQNLGGSPVAFGVQGSIGQFKPTAGLDKPSTGFDKPTIR